MTLQVICDHLKFCRRLTGVRMFEFPLKSARKAKLGAASSRPPSIAQPLAVLAVAIAMGVLMSTQFLAQPFVWRNWEGADIFAGWLKIAGDRAIVATTIAGAAVLGQSLPVPAGRARSLMFGVAIVVGSIAGEFARSSVDPFGDHMDIGSMWGRILQWSAVAGAIAGISMLWRTVSAAALSADEAELAHARTRKANTLAELETLRWQIEPHFLFNTLATIQRLGRTAPDEGLHLLTRLFDFITANLQSGAGDQSTIGAEVDLTNAYLDVCQARMGSRLSVVWQIETRLRLHPFPKYILGTLVENAMKHGISPKAAHGTISILIREVDAFVDLMVKDTGDGIVSQGGPGIGLANLVARLHLIYGDRANFSLRHSADDGTTARIRVPIDADFAND